MRGRRAKLVAIEGGLAEVPRPPDDLPKVMHAEWNTCAADLPGRGLLLASGVGVLASYVTALWTISECRKALDRDGFFVKTKNGEPKPHPGAGLMSKAQDQVPALSKAEDQATALG